MIHIVMLIHWNYQSHIPCSFAYKVVCIDDKFSKPSVLYRGKNAVNKLNSLKQSYKNKILKKSNKKNFNKNLVMSA